MKKQVENVLHVTNRVLNAMEKVQQTVKHACHLLIFYKGLQVVQTLNANSVENIVIKPRDVMVELFLIVMSVQKVIIQIILQVLMYFHA